MPRIGLRCVIVVFPDHTFLLFESKKVRKTTWLKSAAQTTSKYTHRVKAYIERKIGTVHWIRIPSAHMFKLMNKTINRNFNHKKGLLICAIV